ncbi:hypothetical protein [Vibrio superstes]|uniref:Uncharacterized protein n=1 Tax=Vibrio superstes NBRC 103154 TaxID=1219062 RepID=A0A511QRK7_9VIBR|nr:hypothetical protein [Vibrio superstes]GEM79212.1 hypothetical protein VSU01S_14570 [Vibrio superstes NBRC 103154]
MSHACRISKLSSLLIVSALSLNVMAFEAMANEQLTLTCKLSSTPDYFLYYSSQLVFVSNDFALLQNFQGRVSTHIELATGKMIRTTFIGQPFDAHTQTLQGECFEAREVIESWLETEQ